MYSILVLIVQQHQKLWKGVKKKYLWFRFPTDPIFFCRPYYFFNVIDCATLFSPGGCGLLIQRGVCCHTNYWTKLPKFVYRKYASLVNIDVGGLYYKSPSKKTAKTMKKIFKNLFPTYRPQFFHDMKLEPQVFRSGILDSQMGY
jgi:hypothetical protein